jgi:MFS family permease
VGLLISAGALGYSVFQLPAGWLIDRFGVRRMLVVGTFAAGAIILSMLLATPYRSPSRFSSSVASATWRSTTPS